MEIVVGTFEQLLLGYKLEEKNGVSNEIQFTRSVDAHKHAVDFRNSLIIVHTCHTGKLMQFYRGLTKTAHDLSQTKFSLHLRFTNHSHMGAVKSVAISENGILASGSSDESIQLFNLVKGVQLGSLFFHEGSINCLQFFDSSHLFSGSDDGKIAIWKMGSWERQKALTGHKQPVYGFSVHPTGKLGLSVGKDKTLHTWDLTKGKRGFVINTKQVADSVKWSPDGSMFVVIFDSTLDIYSTETASVTHHISSSFKISCVEFIKPEILAVGGAEGIVTFHNTKTGQLISELKTNTIRVKSMVMVEGPGSSDMSLVTASSDGFIKVFKISFENEVVTGDLLVEVQTKFRLICCAAFGSISSAPASVSSPPSDSETSNPEQDIASADEGSDILAEEGNSNDSSAEEGNDTLVEENKERKRLFQLKKKEKAKKLKKKKKAALEKKTEEMQDKKRFRVKEGRIEKSKKKLTKKEKRIKLKNLS